MLKLFVRLLALCCLLFLILLYGFSTIGRLNPSPYLAYLSDVRSQTDIVLADVNQGRSINLTHSIGSDDMMQWSYDGRYLVFRSSRETRWHYFMLDTQNWQISELLSFEREHYFSWFGLTEIAFTDAANGNTVFFNIESRESRTAGAEDNCISHCASPNSYTFTAETLKELELSLVNDEIHVTLKDLDWENMGLVVMSDLPLWSPDRQSFIFKSSLQGQSDIYISLVEGGIARRLTNSREHEDMLSWSQDMNWISYASSVRARLDVFVMNLDTMEIYNLSRYDRPDFNPVWQPLAPKDN